jgi:hypothetical protein
VLSHNTALLLLWHLQNSAEQFTRDGASAELAWRTSVLVKVKEADG